MNTSRRITRRRVLEVLGKAFAGIAALSAFRPIRVVAAAEQKIGGAESKKGNAGAPPSYDPTKHKWRIGIDVDKCIGCGMCVQACKRENKVIPEPFYFRTWVERYIIRKAKPGSGEQRGETIVDSPNGGADGFPPSSVPTAEILKAFHVPKLCNQCKASPCTKSCPVGAAFDGPDGVVLVDGRYCIGCGFCIQACPYGCRFLNPVTKVAEKCTMCYHRITRGLKPACVEVCPTGTRIFGDLMNSAENDPIQEFTRKNRLQALKPHLGTHPAVLYAGLDGEVR